MMASNNKLSYTCGALLAASLLGAGCIAPGSAHAATTNSSVSSVASTSSTSSSSSNTASTTTNSSPANAVATTATSATASSNGLQPQKAWASDNLLTTSALVADASQSVMADTYVVPAKKLVYVHISQLIQNTGAAKTQYSWVVDSLKALDQNTGKVKWTYTFHESAGPYTLYSLAKFTASGTAYVFQSFSDNTYRLYSINSSGELNWIRSLPRQGDGDIVDFEVMQDGSIVAAVQHDYNSKGIYTTDLLRFQAGGKLLNRTSVQGQVLGIQQNRILFNASPLVKDKSGIWGNPYSPQIAVYDLSLKKTFAYKLPKNAYVFSESNAGQLVMPDGSVVIRAEATSTQDKLYGFSPTGTLLWGRLIPVDAFVQPAGSGYATYSPSTMTLDLYSFKGKIATHSFNELADETTDLTTNVNGNLMLNLAQRTYVINPQTLNVALSFATDRDWIDPFVKSYADRAVYTTLNDGKVYRWNLK
ncbi:hypothetical protein [Paenibacillus sp. WLX2291]|uniref:hypothetical protein n=1 Tax=Paenibacillus sp. WLX2291 TaxID=3296934 RepID=UPI0039845938